MLFSGNSTSGWGCVIQVGNEDTVQFENCSFVANSADRGAVFYMPIATIAEYAGPSSLSFSGAYTNPTTGAKMATFDSNTTLDGGNGLVGYADYSCGSIVFETDVTFINSGSDNFEELVYCDYDVEIYKSFVANANIDGTAQESILTYKVINGLAIPLVYPIAPDASCGWFKDAHFSKVVSDAELCGVMPGSNIGTIYTKTATLKSTKSGEDYNKDLWEFQINSDQSGYLIKPFNENEWIDYDYWVDHRLPDNADIVLPAYHNGLPVTGFGVFPISSGTYDNAGAFSARSIGSILLPSTLKEISSGAFMRTAFSSSFDGVVIPDCVEVIDDYAFVDYPKTSINIPSSVTTIGWRAFESSDLTSIHIPSSVSSISESAFLNSVLNAISVDSNNSVYSDGGGNNLLYNKSDKTIIKGSNSTRTLPADALAIANEAFRHCSLLTEIVIPNQVTRIGDNAFSYCTGLTEMHIPSSVTQIYASSFSYSPFYGCNSSMIIYCGVTQSNKPSGWGSCWNFYNASSALTTRWLGWDDWESVFEFVWDYDTNGYMINGYIGSNTHVQIPSMFNNEPVTVIAPETFKGMEFITSVDIGENVIAIGESAFENCYELTQINLPDSLGIIGEAAFAGTGITQIIIPDNVTEIPSRAFQYCALTYIYLHNYITDIGDNAFECSGLQHIFIPKSVSYMGSSVFHYCDGEYLYVYLESGINKNGWESDWNVYQYYYESGSSGSTTGGNKTLSNVVTTSRSAYNSMHPMPTSSNNVGESLESVVAGANASKTSFGEYVVLGAMVLCAVISIGVVVNLGLCCKEKKK